MCDYPGCTSSATVEVRAGDHPVLELCAAHADEAGFPRERCRACGRIVRLGEKTMVTHRPYGDPDGFPLCETCDLLPTARCGICGRIVQVGDTPIGASSYRHDGEVRVCQACGPRVTFRCAVCHAPAGYQDDATPMTMPGASTVHDVDSQTVVGWRCAYCTDGALAQQDAPAHYRQVVDWMTERVNEATTEWPYPVYDGRLTWAMVEDSKLQGESDDAGVRTHGHCRTTSGGQEDVTRHEIEILSYVRPALFQETLTHELTHAWVAEHATGKPHEEGFCNYLAYLRLRHLQQHDASDAVRREAGKRIENLDQSQSPDYGLAFQNIRDTHHDDLTAAINWYFSQD